MARRLIAVAFAICLSGWWLYAAERATFILTSGERISGTLAFHTSTRENLIDNDFSLAVVPGQPEQIFHAAQVAVIDFIGGTPKTSELAALPVQGHLLAMRNGETRLGHFVNLIGGDTLKWQDADNSTRDIPVRDVARIYLNPESARNTFNYAPAAPTAGRAPVSSNNNRVLTIPTNQQWTNTGINVQRGQTIHFRASGNVGLSQNPGDVGTPAGATNGRLAGNSPLPGMVAGLLIGRVGNGPPFAIGAESDVTMPASGRLFLGTNDDYVPDNTGNYVVEMSNR